MEIKPYKGLHIWDKTVLLDIWLYILFKIKIVQKDISKIKKK